MSFGRRAASSRTCGDGQRLDVESPIAFCRYAYTKECHSSWSALTGSGRSGTEKRSGKRANRWKLSALYVSWSMVPRRAMDSPSSRAMRVG